MVSICLVSPTAGFALAYVVGDLDDGAAFIDQALVLNPNLAWAGLFSGYAKLWLGEPEEAIQRVARAMRLSPQDFQFFNMQTATAGTHFVAGRYAEALSWAEAAVRSNQNYILSNSMVAASGALAGRLPDAPKKQKEPWLAYANFNLSCASPI
jgi:tetratricopeptide (TPR) repeat protein